MKMKELLALMGLGNPEAEILPVSDGPCPVRRSASRVYPSQHAETALAVALSFQDAALRFRR